MKIKLQKKQIARFLVIVIWLSCFSVFSDQNVEAAGAPSGIAGNGTGGIYIDINASPYTDFANIKDYGQNAYGTLGCAWFASARVKQLTGVNCTIYSGKTWYNTAYSKFGFTRGREFRGRALACYENHVSVVESVSGTTAVVSEGGYTSVSAANGYCIIHTLSKSILESNRGGNFLGYVYLTESTPTYYDPEGSVDICESSEIGKLRIGGWTYDPDSPSTQNEVHVYIGPNDSDKEGHNLGAADGHRPDLTNQCGAYHGFDKTISTNRTGNQRVRVYAINVGGGNDKLLYDKTVFIKQDSEAPVLVGYNVTKLNEKGYTITCTWEDNVEVTNVEFPTWEAKTNEGNGAVWYKGIRSGTGKTSIWEFTFTEAEAGKQYFTHIYASDAAGNRTCFPLTRTTPIASPIEVKNDTTAPVFEKVTLLQEKEGTATLSVQLSDDTGLGKLDDHEYLYYSMDESSGGVLGYNQIINQNINCWNNNSASVPIMGKNYTVERTVSVQCDSIIGHIVHARDLSGNYAIENPPKYNKDNELITYYNVKSGDVKGKENRSIEIVLEKGEEITLGVIREKLSQLNKLDGSDVYFDAKNERILKKSHHPDSNRISDREEEKKVVLTANEPGTEYVYYLNLLTGEFCSCKIHVKCENIGDVYQDGVIDGKDVSLLLQYRLKKRELTEEQIIAGDVYTDGKIDGKDVSKLLQYRLGKISSLEY